MNKYQSSSGFPTRFVLLGLLFFGFFFFLKNFTKHLESKVDKIQKNPTNRMYKELLEDDGELRGKEKLELYKELLK
ncbi:MAG TPA: hypothetical protein PLD27_06580 [bacterium]|nr:hypothetical protein [bacterium]HOL46558.1 hypothetical protein [bacterium]HPQ17871.1 hypothetical protein [bacterium]